MMSGRDNEDERVHRWEGKAALTNFLVSLMAFADDSVPPLAPAPNLRVHWKHPAAGPKW